MHIDDSTTNGSKTSAEDIRQENVDLKRQLLLLQMQLEDKDKTIKLLQSQMVINLDCTTRTIVLIDVHTTVEVSEHRESLDERQSDGGDSNRTLLDGLVTRPQ